MAGEVSSLYRGGEDRRLVELVHKVECQRCLLDEVKANLLVGSFLIAGKLRHAWNDCARCTYWWNDWCAY